MIAKRTWWNFFSLTFCNHFIVLSLH